ncbi:aromatic ring-hydroxylating oxygenase subunit alpha [Sneathiella limimaris]|uniref:aromatic ring-hydroxylating oxygenase subunit alpha n=1 Tax=Sneathiella limimaris TaxID=1964213 RepID=UPI00146CC33C|nr:SRPBCC family protein [Sneathiella limimaris]
MDRQTELSLLRELVSLSETHSAFLDTETGRSAVTRYLSEDRFDQELSNVFKKTPLIGAHVSQLENPGDFVTTELAGLPILVVRDKEGTVRVFLNVCRHRGAKLEKQTSGCKRIFTCPYHAWSYNSDGSLRGIPQEKQGFPDIDKQMLNLKSLAVEEKLGWIWVRPDLSGEEIRPDFLAPIEDMISWIGFEDYAIAETTELDVKANWKVLVEGGIEAYHFKVAHKDTIGPHFMNNLSSYQVFGQNLRSILPRESLKDMAKLPEDQWNIRDHTNVLYSVFPLNQFLMMQDHIAWVQMNPISAGQTKVKISTLAPKAEVSEDKADHWKRNQQITLKTLTEDFEIGEDIQSGLASRANETLIFGKFEGALTQFNAIVDGHLAASS